MNKGLIYVKLMVAVAAFMAGDISEIMLYNRPLSSPEIESAGTYLSEKYPNNHGILGTPKRSDHNHTVVSVCSDPRKLVL